MKTYIWSLPTRIFHWLFVTGMVAAYILSEEKELLNVHSSIGYAVGILLIFRIIWGFVGPRYSRFVDFPMGFSAIKLFITDMKRSKNESLGHNPAAAVVMLAIILLGLTIVITGTMLLASEGQGFFSQSNKVLSSDSLKETHEIAVNILIFLVIAHLLGNLVDFIFNKKAGTLGSIFTGYKNVQGENVELSSFQKIIATFSIVAALAMVPITLATQKINTDAEKTERQEQGSNDENKENEETD